MGRREFCALACSIQPFVSDHARESYVGSTTSLEPDSGVVLACRMDFMSGSPDDCLLNSAFCQWPCQGELCGEHHLFGARSAGWTS